MTNPTIAIQANRLENLASHVHDAQVRRELRSVAAELRKVDMVSGSDPVPPLPRALVLALDRAARPIPFGGCPECGSVKCVARACVLPPGLAAVPIQPVQVGYINRGIAPHTDGRITFHVKPTVNLEARWWSQDEPVYTLGGAK